MAGRFRSFKYLIALICCVFLSGSAVANHLYGGELYYTYMIGSRYTVTMILYGDCSSTSVAFDSLYTATPEVQVYNGTTLFRTMRLKVQAGAGTEVTPVCASSLGSTTCRGGLVPGIRRFIYADTISLSASTSWRFRSTGNLINSYSGRSMSITNLIIPSTGLGSLMSLEATLNNNLAPNSNPTFTTIPTPFFCINIPQEYNQGAVDVNTGDSLVYALVDGLDASTAPVSLVTYRTGYSATAPLAVATGTFSFSSSTGQLTFKPNLTQISAVVCKVYEYRGGVLVGTCMREMNFIVLSSCSNNSPTGDIGSTVTGGTWKSATTVDICKNESTLNFSITPTDADGDTITVSYSGLPPGATMTITGSGTKSPSCAFSWNISGVAPGTYYFYMTYQDNGCPLSSKQTIAYTINVVPKPAFNYELVSAATCVRKAVFKVTPVSGSTPWSLSVISGAAMVHTISGITTATLDSMAPGTYTLRLKGNNNCYTDTVISLAVPPVPAIGSYTATSPVCFGSSTGSMTITGTGTLAPYTYAMGIGSYTSSGNFSGLSAGTYVLHIRDANSCQKDTTVVLAPPPAIKVESYSAIPATCSYNTDASVTIAGTGTVSPYTYAIGSGAYTASGTFNGLASGTYVLHIRDANNCQKDTAINIVAPPALKIGSYTATPISCNGSTDASITLTGTGTVSPYTYAIGSASYTSSGSFIALAPGTYVLHIRDANNCQKDTTVTIVAPPVLKIGTYSATAISCYNSTDASSVITGSGGTPTYTYAIGSGTYTASGTFTALAPGTYTLHIRDANNCQKDTTVSFVAPPALTISSYTSVAPVCYNSTDGSLTISGAGGTAPYTYAQGSSVYSSSGTFSTLAAGTYMLHIRDAKSCQKDTTVTLTGPPPVVVSSYVATLPSCYNGTDGSIVISGTSTAPPYTYAIGSGAYTGSGTFSSLAPGTYILHIRDAKACQKDTTVTLGNRSPLTISYTVKKAICNSVSDGRITAVVTGGVAPYQYAIGASGAFGSANIFTALASGTYTIRVKDANNCMNEVTVAVADSIAIGTLVDIKNAACNGSKDALITVNGRLGTGPYTYALGTGSFTATNTFPGLGAGTYLVKVRDAYGCTKDSAVTVTEPSAVAVKAAVVNPVCIGDKNGTITLSGSGGTAPYGYAIASGAPLTSPLFKDLGLGTYVLSVVDANSCKKDTLISLKEPDPIYPDVTFTEPLCYGSTDGTITVHARGGAPAYQYAVDGGTLQTANTFRNIAGGNRIVQVTDSKGCKKDTTVVVTRPVVLIINGINTINPTCEGYPDGSVKVSASGGTPAYSYATGTGTFSPAAAIASLREGTYQLHVRDANGCQADSSFTLTGYPHIVADSTITLATSCFGRSDAAFRFYASGGNSPLTYVMDGRTDTASGHAAYEGLSAGNYTIIVTDATRCSKSFDIPVADAPQLSITMDVIPNNCIGMDTSGAITARVNGGTAPYTFMWSNGNSGDSVIRSLSNGSYSVRIADKNECKDSATGTVIFDNCCVPAIPNAFTPNNDGNNDIFRIIYKGDIVLKEFSIYNRYGQQVFTTTDINTGWNGTFNGQMMDLGTYYYYVRMLCGNRQDTEVSYKGDVILIR